MDKTITILGRKVELHSVPPERLKGVTIGEKILFSFYSGAYSGAELLFVEPKQNNPTPRVCAITSGRIEVISGLPVVFILHPGPTYERNRLLDKGVYFVMGDHFAFLPMIASLDKVGHRKTAERLSPSAQYLLLYHLQIESLEGLSAKVIAPLMPYSYESVTLGIACLSDLGIINKAKAADRSETIHFGNKGKDLWEQAQAYMSSPVVTSFYCDDFDSEHQFQICGVNALSHYSRLNPDDCEMMAMTAEDRRHLENSNSFVNKNPFDGKYYIEVWKYRPVRREGADDRYVDRLSLALSLKNDEDPRVENEVEYMINKTIWKG